MGFFDKIKKIGIFNGFSQLDDDFYEELEESLVMADLGAETTMEAVEELRSRCKAEKIKDMEGARQCMRDILAEYLSIGDLSVDMSRTPAIVLFIGVNGVGKTTSIGKLAARWKREGKKVLLCAGEGDQVLLCWQEMAGGGFYSCSTALTQALHLEPVASSVTPNGAYFAFENQALTDRLAPYTLVTEGELGGEGYAMSVPLVGEGETLTVLAALDFNSQNPAPVSGGEVYVDGGDRLVVSDSGVVTYRAAQGEKYPVGPALADGVETARALAESTLGTLCGEARLYLMSAQEAGGAVRVRFGYLLDGCAVYLGSEGWAAEFVIRNGYITQFTLRFRSYAANGEQTLLLPVDKAAAMLPDLTDQRRELVLQYRDGGGAAVFPSWVAV